MSVNSTEARSSSARARRVAPAIAALAIVALSAAAARAECAAPAAAMNQVEMYFGASVKGQPFVTEAMWRNFLSAEVTPKFPDGLTVWNAEGQWRSGDGHIYGEATHVLLILYKADAASEGKIEAIRAAYKTQFHQEDAPLRVDSVVCATF